jgi:hypothetical protein
MDRVCITLGKLKMHTSFSSGNPSGRENLEDLGVCVCVCEENIKIYFKRIKRGV